MEIGQRLRTLREEKNFSQGDIEKATGLLRCYVSRVENGHTVPTVETLEKWARALDMPLYKVMYEGDEPPKPRKLAGEDDKGLWGQTKNEASELARLRRNLAKMDAKRRTLLLGFAGRLARHSGK
ncbi:MAG TPA: helix-turn-helix transcriptional regulator [Candidatus Methylomirabilis sp.]|nr:helix-turn-helix transcriptional regulator [Candidatus Methylomirabilis sp.]